VSWSVTNIGSGYSSPIIVGDRIYITGDEGDELHILALDLTGNLVWRATNGGAWKTPYPGARASCAYASGRIYHLNAHGEAACFEARDGKPVWKVNTITAFGSRVPTWGLAECLLVDGNRVIVTPGGRKAAMAALDRTTGQTVWTTARLPGEGDRIEGPAYASPVLIQTLGQRQIVGVAARHFFGVEAQTGKLQWQFDMPTRHEVLGSSAAFCNDGVFVTGPDAEGGKFLRFKKTADTISVEPVWTASMDTCHGGIIALDGYLYGSWYRSFNGWGCVKAKDGSVPWRDRELPMGSAIYADGRLYCLAQNGVVALVRPNPEKMEIVSRFVFAREHQNNVWAHPVILEGRLYLRHQQTLRCFDIRRKEP
jgi:outer membrane protein assembly factor BamB